jgi:hypothetical protein
LEFTRNFRHHKTFWSLQMIIRSFGIYSVFHNHTESQKKKKIVCSYLALKHFVLRRHTEMTTMPSSSPEPLQPPESCFTALILACLLVHVPVQGIAKKKSTRKETRTKEFTHSFLAMKSNYIQLLNSILEKHHIGNKFHATERRHYGCKIQVPPAK